jgi:RNA polymerase sigma-70 factor (ECF subfamily)
MIRHDHHEPLVDDVLLENVCSGCSDCFALLFHRYFRQVFSIAYRILHDRSEAEDILQEVFLAIFLQQERFDNARGSVKTWILQFAYFKSLLRRRYLRIRNFYKQDEVSETRDVRRNPTSQLLGMSSAEWAHYVESGIASLSPKQRRVIALIHFEGYTLQESSEIERETLANTRNHYYRGLKALRIFLNAQSDLKKVRETAVLEGNDAYRFES